MSDQARQILDSNIEKPETISLETASDNTVRAYKRLHEASHANGITPAHQLRPGYDGRYDTEYRNAKPHHAELIKTPENFTVRHYFREEDTADMCTNLQAIPAGKVPYVEKSPMIRNEYTSLKGVFFTTPGAEPERVGVPGFNYYVDVTLPEGTNLVRCTRSDDKNPIYLIIVDPGTWVDFDITNSGLYVPEEF